MASNPPLQSYAFSWVWVREESTKGDTIPANVTADTRKCLPPNADKLYKTDVQGRWVSTKSL